MLLKDKKAIHVRVSMHSYHLKAISFECYQEILCENSPPVNKKYWTLSAGFVMSTAVRLHYVKYPSRSAPLALPELQPFQRMVPVRSRPSWSV